LLDDPVIVGIAQRLRKTPAQAVLSWALQRGTALLTTSVAPKRIQENFELSAIPEDACLALFREPVEWIERRRAA
jgi:diketogulonate reductase-like aldo/keto reductase